MIYNFVLLFSYLPTLYLYSEKPGSVESKSAELDPPKATVAVAEANRETLDIEGWTETPKPPTELEPDSAVQGMIPCQHV